MPQFSSRQSHANSIGSIETPKPIPVFADSLNPAFKSRLNLGRTMLAGGMNPEYVRKFIEYPEIQYYHFKTNGFVNTSISVEVGFEARFYTFFQKDSIEDLSDMLDQAIYPKQTQVHNPEMRGGFIRVRLTRDTSETSWSFGNVVLRIAFSRGPGFQRVIIPFASGGDTYPETLIQWQSPFPPPIGWEPL